MRCAVTHIPDEWLSLTEPGLSADSLHFTPQTPLPGRYFLIFYFRFAGQASVFPVDNFCFQTALLGVCKLLTLNEFLHYLP